MANTLNYSSPGGDEWVVGGRLVIREGAVVEGLPSVTIPKVSAVMESQAEDLEGMKRDFNALIFALKLSGLMER